GFAGATKYGGGAYPGFSEHVFTISTQLNDAQHGKTICVDSTWYPPENKFIWASDTGVTGVSTGEIVPRWDGPYCFDIVDPNAPEAGNIVAVPTSLTMSADVISAATASLAINSSNEVPFNYTVSEDANWLGVDPASGTSGSSITVTAHGLFAGPAGVYTATITITSPTALNSPVTVPVTFTVTDIPPTMECPDPFTETVCSVEEQICVPLPIENYTSISIFPTSSGVTWADNELCFFPSNGSYTYHFIVTATNGGGEVGCNVEINVTVNTPPVITCPGTQTITLDSPGEWCYPLDITGADVVGITGDATLVDGQACFAVATDGSYSATVAASNSCGGVTCILNVDFIIEKNLEVTPTDLAFSGMVGGTSTEMHPLSITEADGFAIGFDIYAYNSWILLSGASGTTAQDIDVSVDLSSFTEAGVYNSLITISSIDAVNTLAVPVTLTLSAVPTAKMQLVHNSADPAVELVDVWVNGEKMLTDFAFRSATPFMDIPSDMELLFQFAPAPSSSVGEAVAQFTFVAPGLTTDASYIGMLGGLVEPSAFAPNPDGRLTDFVIFTKEAAKMTGDGSGAFDFFIQHGLTDGVQYDMTIQGEGSPLVTNLAYGDMTAYTSRAAEGYILLELNSSTEPSEIPLRFEFYLTGLGGRAGVLFASGFEEPANNGDGPSLGLYVALDDGTVFNLPEIAPLFVETSPDTLYFVTVEGEPVADPKPFGIVEAGGGNIPYTLAVPFEIDWLYLEKGSGVTPDNVLAGPNTVAMDPGDYYAPIYVDAVDADNSDSVIIAYTITALEFSEVDFISTLPPVAAHRGQTEIAVPVTITNACDLFGLIAAVGWSSEYLVLDSVSQESSELTGLWGGFTVEIAGMLVSVEAGTNVGIAAGTYNLMTLYFTVAEDAPYEFYPVTIVEPLPRFTLDCPDLPASVVIPTLDAEDGGIGVGPIIWDLCGYVVEPGSPTVPIEGATVEVWDVFPTGLIIETMTTDATGLFECVGIDLDQIDIWVHKDGYYPKLTPGVVMGDDPTIVLEPWVPMDLSTECVYFYCDGNTFMGAPMPVGSVIDAYTPNGVHCGTKYVTTEGRYEFMAVHRDDETVADTTGAYPGEAISFYINGMKALTTGNTEWTVDQDIIEVCLDAGLLVTHTCDLAVGWNLVSWPVDNPSDFIKDALAESMADIDQVSGFEQGGLTYVSDPSLEMFSTLWYVDHLSGYWIKANKPMTLTIEGTEVAAITAIPLTAGWNLVSYLAEDVLAPEVALADLIADDNLIVAKGYGETYMPGAGSNNTMYEMARCLGYWLKVNHVADLVYPGAPGMPAAPRVDHNRIAAKGVPTDLNTTALWVNVYSRDLMLDGNPVVAGTMVEAYNSDGVKVGGFTIRETGKFGFMSVYGDDRGTGEAGVGFGEEFTLRVAGVQTEESFTWTQNGDLVEISNLTSKAGTGSTLPSDYSLYQNYPNPFNPSTTLSFHLATSGKATIEVFNVLGKRVAVPFDGVAQAGTTDVVWDGRNSEGEVVSSGIYFYRLTADSYTETRKMTLLK
ncbi:MAG: T9SS type A sorting domain-containing protein, partial [candidate division Zixibacteria bacterium]|nr:T9SS type A sorting domain-containing protein [candidate division Zixibacteria bacterium]